jgi:adenylate cyclase
VALVSVHGIVVGRRRWSQSTAWLVERRPPRADERRALYSFPNTLSALAVTYWAIGLVWIVPYFIYVLHFRAGMTPYLKIAVSFGFCAFIGWSLSYLLVERALRPIVASAMSADASLAPKTLTTATRLVLAWAATAGVPIAGIAMSLFGLDASQTVRIRPFIFLACLVGTFVGVLIAAFSGRVIADPIRKVSAGMRSVELGDLDTEVPVTETAELGDLEIGFNRMVSGLRERERMRDVFGRHVGAEVARRAMETEFESGGERCHATAMFVDIIGSTGLTQRRDPEAVVAILNRFFDAVVRVVASEGGLVNKFQGDGALCLFGTPLPVDDHAARGLRAARALARELAPLGDIAAAIGVSSGEVVAGNVGTADRYEYTVIGDAVNEAARLTELAKLKDKHVLVSERTILEAGAEHDGWEPGETIQLRGRSEPTLTFEPA